jgi:hypothetical protein
MSDKLIYENKKKAALYRFNFLFDFDEAKWDDKDLFFQNKKQKKQNQGRSCVFVHVPLLKDQIWEK